MKIQARLLLMSISMTLIAMLIALLISSFLIRVALESDAEEKLAAIQEARYSSLQRYLDTIHREMHVLAVAPVTVKSLIALSDGYAKLGKNAQTLLQQNYRPQNKDYDNS